MPTPSSGAVVNNPITKSDGLGIAGLGLLGATGLLGGGGTVQNPYAAPANADYTNAETNAAAESGGGMALTNAGESALSGYQSFAPQANQATQNELNYLNTNPYTDAYSQAKLSQATGGAMRGYAQARSQLASSLAARGLAGPAGGQSSELTGGEAGIDAAEAGTLAGAQNNIALDAITQRGQNLALANQIAAQHASSLFSQGEGGVQGGGSVLQGAGGLYDQTANDWLNEGQQEIQNTQNANNSASGSWAGLAGIGLKAAGF